MELFSNGNQTLMPGQRLLKVKGFDPVEKYPMPRDCEAVFFDEDEDVGYIKKTDSNGGETLLMFDMVFKPIPKFDPKKYVSVDDFKAFKEEILNGFNSLQQTIANSVTNSNAGNGSKSNWNGKQSNKPNNGVDQPANGV